MNVKEGNKQFVKVDKEAKESLGSYGTFPNCTIKFKDIHDNELVNFERWAASEIVIDVMDPLEKEMTSVIRDHVSRNRSLPKYKKLQFRPLWTHENKIAMLAPHDSRWGWLTFRSPEYWNFIVNLRNKLIIEAKNEEEMKEINKLGVNRAKCHPYGSMIHSGETYKASSSDYDREELKMCGKIVGEKQWRNYRNTPIIDCGPRLKPNSNMGYPWETPDGDVVDAKSVYWGNESNHEAGSLLLHADWYGGKYSWAGDHDHGSTHVFRKQWEYRKDCHNPEMLLHMFETGVITIATMATRTNNADPVISDSGPWKNAENLYSKNRIMSIERDGKFLTSEIDTRRHSNFVHEKYGLVGASNKERWMYPSNNAQAHLYGNMLAKRLTKNLEDGVSGLPANRPILLKKYKQFVSRHKGKKQLKLFNTDRSNAEKWIASNMDLCLDLLDPAIAEYLRITATTIVPSNEGPRVVLDGYCSAVWYTTYFHLNLGPYEGFRCILDGLGVKETGKRLAAFTKMYDALYDGEADVEFLPGCHICAFAGTDDVVLLIAIPEDVKLLDISKDMEKRMLSGGFVDSCIAFGIQFTTESMEVAEASSLGKLFTPEHPGDGDHDAFVTQMKIQSSGRFQPIILDAMKECEMGSANGYSGARRGFMERLSRDGIMVEDIFNLFSPKERILFGNFVDIEQIGKTHRLPDKDCEIFAKNLDETIYANRRYGRDKQVCELEDRKFDQRGAGVTKFEQNDSIL